MKTVDSRYYRSGIILILRFWDSKNAIVEREDTGTRFQMPITEFELRWEKGLINENKN